MYKIICITNRTLIPPGQNFLSQIERIAAAQVDAIILREKDLSCDEYEILARQVLETCERHNTKCILHYFVEVARRLSCDSIHLPLPVFENMSDTEKAYFNVIGVSTHSIEEAERAKNAGATYITAGHVFPTDCKKDLPPKGISLLKDIVERVSIPVYGLGGIHADNAKECVAAGASGVCLMSDFMKCTDPGEIVKTNTNKI